MPAGPDRGRALQDRAALVARLAELEREAAEVRARIASFDNFLTLLTTYGRHDVRPTIMDAAETFLRDQPGQRAHTSEIVQHVREAGWLQRSDAHACRSAVVTSLNRHPERFAHLRHGWWGLRQPEGSA